MARARQVAPGSGTRGSAGRCSGSLPTSSRARPCPGASEGPAGPVCSGATGTASDGAVNYKFRPQPSCDRRDDIADDLVHWGGDVGVGLGGQVQVVGHRRRRRGLMHGVAQWSVSRRDGALVGDMALRPSADESAIRDGAAPVVLAVTHIGAVATVRDAEPACDGEPARRTLRLSGEMVAMRLALLQGTLRRPRAENDCDFLVERGHHIRRSPSAALISLAAELPAPMLAVLLDLNIDTALQWAQHASRDWSHYLQARTGTTRDAALRSPTGHRSSEV